MNKSTHRDLVRLPLDETKEHLMVHLARMAYQQNKTLTEIANETGMNRWRVSKLLQEALDIGIVRIEIVPRFARQPELEARLIEKFSLRDAIVVTRSPHSEHALERVAQAAGQYLAALQPQPKSVGVSWGRTMSAVAHWLAPQWNNGATVIQINGTVAIRESGPRTNDVADIFARKGHGRYLPLPVPSIVGEKATRRVLEKDRIVADVLAAARRAEVLCFSLGHVDLQSVLVTSGNIAEKEMTDLLAAGAVGDVLGRFFNVEGQVVDHALDERTIGLTLAELSDHDHSIGVVTGSAKHDAVLGALRARILNVLITDQDTAEFALEKANEP
jgi:deoxyribonucleoside regulator